MGKLVTVTITGADDSIDVGDLVGIIKDFPFVEWGVLISAKQSGSPRYPSDEWMVKFALHVPALISLHLCGSMMRKTLMGEDCLSPGARWLLAYASRVRMQFNFHAEPQRWDLEALGDRLTSWQKDARAKTLTPICQIDGKHGEDFLPELWEAGFEQAVPLFDLSHGAGISPAQWPAADFGIGDDPCMHGYAGGLGPDNLEREIPRIIEAAGAAEVWIDMETKVRSIRSGDDVFDLDKVRRCLEIAAKFIAS